MILALTYTEAYIYSVISANQQLNRAVSRDADQSAKRRHCEKVEFHPISHLFETS